MQKTDRIGLRITISEKEALKRLAEFEGGLSMAALLRRLIRKTAQSYGIWSVGDDTEHRDYTDKEVSMEK
jgi:hypothetical protein